MKKIVIVHSTHMPTQGCREFIAAGEFTLNDEIQYTRHETGSGESDGLRFTLM